MHWAHEKAQELIANHPDLDEFVCASGISPSGSVHIGNFREIVTTFFVAQALRRLGKKVRFIFSWDDYDRFRKVPKNVDESFSQYIGMPYTQVPDPHGCHATYAEHFQEEFEKSLEVFGIDVEFIYQTKEYRSGRYNPQILLAFKKRKEIYDILMSFKTQEPTDEERENFYPATVYCSECRKDNTKITSFNESTEEIEYVCQCGHQETIEVLQSSNLKLVWRVDWPMRWMIEGVVFEPGGRDHSAETGSYNVGKVIAKEIFNYKAPDYVAYEFIGVKGGTGKMSSSSGNTVIPAELLKIYLPEIILFIFSKYKPGAAFNIGMDEDVIRNYTEFERYRSAYLNGKLQDEDLKYSLELAGVESVNDQYAKFSNIIGVLPLANFEAELVQDILSRTGIEHSIEDILPISERAEYWIKNWYPEKMIYLNTEFNQEYYATLDDTEKQWLSELCDVVKGSDGMDDQDILGAVYAVCDDPDKKVKKANQQRLFAIVYMLVVNQNSGPRLPLLIKTVSIPTMLTLLGCTV